MAAMTVLSDMVLDQHPLIFSASALQSLIFEDGAVPKHHHVSITLSSNGPHQIRQMKFIVACFVHVGADMRLLQPSSN